MTNESKRDPNPNHFNHWCIQMMVMAPVKGKGNINEYTKAET